MKDKCGFELGEGEKPKYEEDEKGEYDGAYNSYVELIETQRLREIRRLCPEFDVPIVIDKEGCVGYRILHTPYTFQEELDNTVETMSQLVATSPDNVYFSGIPVGIRPLTHSNMYEQRGPEPGLGIQVPTTEERKIAPDAHLVAEMPGVKVFFTDGDRRQTIHIHVPLYSWLPVDVVIDDAPNIKVTYRKQVHPK